MIRIKDVTITDILPYTFKRERHIALSRAIAALTGKLYAELSSVLFRADISNAAQVVLDALAAEFDAPFYSTDLSDEQKRAIIAAADEYNSKVGTTGSIQKLLEAAFGNGVITEWFDYGGDPYYFKINVNNKYPGALTRDGYKTFFKNIEKVKPARAKLEDLHITHNTEGNQYAAAGIIKTYKKITVPLAVGIEVT